MPPWRVLGIHPRTVARWKSRREVRRSLDPPASAGDPHHRLGRRLDRRIAPQLGAAARRHHCGDAPLLGPEPVALGDLRCLQRLGLSHRPATITAASGRFAPEPCGFIDLDLKHLTRLRGERAYAYVAIDRATRFVDLEIHGRRAAATARTFLECFARVLPAPIRGVLTDNGSEFTDRFAVEMKNKPAADLPVATPLTRPARCSRSNIVRPNRSDRRPMAWSNASTAAGPRRCAPRNMSTPDASLIHINSATPSSRASSMTTTTQDCDAWPTKPPANPCQSPGTQHESGDERCLVRRFHPATLSSWIIGLPTKSPGCAMRSRRPHAALPAALFARLQPDRRCSLR